MSEERSEELVALSDVREGISEHMRRLREMHNKGRLQPVLAEELVSTILPLVLELSEAVLANAEVLDEWAEDVDDAIEEGLGMRGVLSPEEVQLFGWLFERLNDFVQGVKANEAPEEMKKAMSEIEDRLKQAVTVLDRFAEDDGDFGNDDGDDGLEESSGAEVERRVPRSRR